MKGYFVTGTDTGVGKTVISSVLMSLLECVYWKPIQSGIAVDPLESDVVKNLAARSTDAIYPSHYLLQASLSPDQAAKLESKKIEIANLALPVTTQPLIVEGAGGLLVPLNTKERIIDLIEKISLPVIVVARGTLGTINHTLLTIEALKNRHIPIHGIVYNGELHLENRHAIEHWGGIKTLFHLPHIATLNSVTLNQWVEENRTTLKESLCL